MAGIGFELRRIFKRNTLASALWGTFFATVTTIGPTVTFVILLFVLRFVMNYYGTDIADKEFFVASFTYVFLTAVLIAAVMNAVVSRFISDKIFEEKEGDVGASIFGVMTVGTVAAGIVFFILCFLMYQTDQVSMPFLIAYYCLGVLATNTFNLMAYVTALKEYKEVTFSYLAGLLVAIPVFYLLFSLSGFSILFSLYVSLAAGFFVVDLLLLFFCIRAFGMPATRIFEFLRYFRMYPELAITGFCYMLGFYISNIIYWNFSELRVQTNIFWTAPSYDLAMFGAILVNLPALVIFVVKAETIFYEKYVQYLSALNKGSYILIEKRRANMQNTLKLQLFFVYEVQLIITILVICAANLAFPLLGIGTYVFNLFMVLSLGVYCTLSMYLTILYLYYFEDYRHAAVVAVLYLLVETVGAILCANLSGPFYPLPLLAAGVTGWLVAFLFLRRRLVTLNGYLLCK